jgi:hypothetical protein
MYTKIQRLLVTIGTLLLCTTVSAEVVHPELPIETTDVSITQAKSGGFLLTRPCGNCPMMSLQFDANSKAIKNGKPVDLSRIPSHSNTGITVFYDPTTKVVHRVTW